ncbi:helix-turn-helix transcriptional regulator [Kitasatospora sp. NBC_01287]|uniref:response regulator transcription factor n=1 Tax=Kitasatospora sp. NBC_01287 TaxID=2903573 RepID=UPI00224E9CE2|nr:helix-turn-helix transcriptional regulator [Kitasatospora sp. NBC_01287]MCX4751302.1 helix-turn-helix transcriptional regulator [Kitasatospora sp. NBC_01287]
MTLAATSAPAAPATCVRIAITSPDILARIRQVFASKNLVVDIVRMPYVEVTVRPAAGPAATDRSVAGAALEGVVGPDPRVGAPGARRLCAEYRLNVVEVGGRPTAERSPGEGRPRLTVAPDTDTATDTATATGPTPVADGPVAALSQRQHEVMALVSRGARNAEIAARLHVSEKTVKNHINRIFRSLGAGSRVEAVLIWQRGRPQGAIRRGAPDPVLVPLPRPVQLPVPVPVPVPVGSRRPAYGGSP